MGTKREKQERRIQLLVNGGWAAGIGITLVEMHFGMDYVFSHLASSMNSIAGWLPMIGALAKQFCG